MLGIDKNDPYAGGVSYPHFTLGEPFLDKLGLTPDDARLAWLDKRGVIAVMSHALAECGWMQITKSLNSQGTE